MYGTTVNLGCCCTGTVAVIIISCNLVRGIRVSVVYGLERIVHRSGLITPVCIVIISYISTWVLVILAIQRVVIASVTASKYLKDIV